ncbi:uncharacterized protein K489DRAFT_383332 [Dissoconium aciculare CBS 342.82]|uniref:Secreted protein n=1 Tax=Dissoconium aciculare CBS 342.82 TaxID=1314786 RepID=A0A6J3LVQ0_9PEZI|nr:uncharacterized protein K489DRAFT_383332 [Dissoconium aciculare CBS 342.82]KAF1819758.1 hypothetical protein K489DRAFT_383332 [Dissoconium aciculare CBS 342.82]
MSPGIFLYVTFALISHLIRSANTSDYSLSKCPVASQSGPICRTSLGVRPALRSGTAVNRVWMFTETWSVSGAAEGRRKREDGRFETHLRPARPHD